MQAARGIIWICTTLHSRCWLSGQHDRCSACMVTVQCGMHGHWAHFTACSHVHQLSWQENMHHYWVYTSCHAVGCYCWNQQVCTCMDAMGGCRSSRIFTCAGPPQGMSSMLYWHCWLLCQAYQYAGAWCMLAQHLSMVGGINCLPLCADSSDAGIGTWLATETS